MPSIVRRGFNSGIGVYAKEQTSDERRQYTQRRRFPAQPELMKPHEGQPILTAGTPLGQSATVAILLHGRNATPQDILEIVPVLNRPGVTYLAPTAANHTWYPYSFLMETSRNEPDLSSALWVLEMLTASLAAQGIRRDRTILMGFSQGACLASEFAVRHAARYGGIVAFSGGLIGPPGATWNHSGSFDGTPVFLGCSDVDSHIPKERVEESAEVFKRMGADVTRRLYPGMGHTVNADEIEAARAIVDGIR
jgi:predicted esterase